MFLVEYTESEDGKSAHTMSSKVDWRDVLNPSQFAVYDLLRKTRKEIGDKTKIPLYGILSNEQLALMAQNPPKTKEDFLKIKGVNEQKYKQFGEIFLKAIETALLSQVKVETVISTGSSIGIDKSNSEEATEVISNKSENSAESQLKKAVLLLEREEIIQRMLLFYPILMERIL